MHSIRKFTLILCLSLHSLFLTSKDTTYHLTLEKKILDNSWNLPIDLPRSFKNYNENKYSISAQRKNFSILFSKDKFHGKGDRILHPKKLSSQISSREFILGYKIDDYIDVNLLAGNSKTSPEFFDCYQTGNLIIGGCDDADFRIESNLAKYGILENNLLFIQGKSKKMGLNLIFKTPKSFIDQYSVGYSLKKTKFNWLSPIEEIDSPVILNSIVNGVRVGSAIDKILLDLPQRNTWKTNIFSLGIYKEFNLSNFKIFLDNKIFLGNRKNFYKFKDSNNSNLMLNIGLSKKINSVEFQLTGTFYSNFLLWDKEEMYNFRTQDYFNDNFGFIAFKVKYDF